MNDRAALQAVGTFMGVPASRDLSGSKAAVLGIPFDYGFRTPPLGAHRNRLAQ
jgi:hypothetical protein